MAPITRGSRAGNALVPPETFYPKQQAQQSTSGESWDLIETEQPSRDYREMSEGQNSFDENEYDDYQYDLQERNVAVEDSPEDHEDILHPLREAANRVGREVERFAEVLDGYNPNRSEDETERHEMTFDLLDKYHSIAVDTVERLRETHSAERQRQLETRWRRDIHGFKLSKRNDEPAADEDDLMDIVVQSSQTTVKDLERWEQEADTWDLLRRLLRLQHSPPPKVSSRKLHRYASERDVWNKFIDSDNLALERKTVLDWFKDTADESGEDIDVMVHELQQNAERGDIVAHGWLHTKAAIKNQKRIHVWPQVLDPNASDVQRVHVNSDGTRKLVTQLDPDAVTRQGRQLEAQDEYFERAIWLGCYEMLRRGKSGEEIREWCRERTEIWRAVSLSGLPEEYSNEQDPDSENDLKSGLLWRRMCFALTRRDGVDPYERAVYGILGGDLESVEVVARGWDDLMFAHYNALLRTQFDIYLQNNYPDRAPAEIFNSISGFDAQQYHGEVEGTAKRLVDSLKNSSLAKEESREPMKMIQGILIAKQFDKFIHQQGLALAKFANTSITSKLIPPLKTEPKDVETTAYIALEDQDGLRVLTHMLLIFKNFGLDLGSGERLIAIENIIAGYISFLRFAGKEELIPLYSAQLSGDRVYATLSRTLVDMNDAEQRLTQVKLIKELGLDVQKFVRYQTRFLMNDNEDIVKGYPASEKFNILEERGVPQYQLGPSIKQDFVDGSIDRVDVLLIRSLEWYLLVDGLWVEVFRTGTYLYQRFFRQAKLAAARMLALKMHSSEIARQKTPAILGESIDLDTMRADCEDEDLSEAIEGKPDEKKLLKRHMLAEAKNYTELETLAEVLDSLEDFSGIVVLLQEEFDNQDSETSDPLLRRNYKLELNRIINSLKTDITPLFHGWLMTSQQPTPEFQLLRQSYLPDIILAFLSALQFAGRMLSRENLLHSLDLATIIAAEDSDLIDVFTRTGRIQELVTAFAKNSQALLWANTEGSGLKRKREIGSGGVGIWDIEL